MLEPYWGSSWMPCCCPVWWRACSFRSSGRPPSCAPAVHRGGGCWGEPTLDLGGSWVGQPANSSASSPSGWVPHSTVWVAHPTPQTEGGRASSPALTPLWADLPLPYNRVSSTMLPRFGGGQALLSATVSKGQGPALLLDPLQVARGGGGGGRGCGDGGKGCGGGRKGCGGDCLSFAQVSCYFGGSLSWVFNVVLRIIISSKFHM